MMEICQYCQQECNETNCLECHKRPEYLAAKLQEHNDIDWMFEDED